MPAVNSLSTKFGDPLPPHQDHDEGHPITVHFKDWDSFQRYLTSNDPKDKDVKSEYPRSGPFGYVVQLMKQVSVNHFKNQPCLLFGSRLSAERCLTYSVSPNRKLKYTPENVHIEAIRFPLGTLWAFCGSANLIMNSFWHDAGVGISPRIAKDALDNYEYRAMMNVGDTGTSNGEDGLTMESQAFAEVKRRIADLLNRAPLRGRDISSDQVFLFPTGMAAIFQLQRYLYESSADNPGSTILFGFAFMATEPLLREYSSSFKWFRKGDDEDLSQLESFCREEAKVGRKVQALWLEFPSNPNLQLTDLRRIHRIASKYGFYVFIDDTISSFCNVDLFDIADALVTSLTKCFSGYANVMGGSVVLNPRSAAYPHLSTLFAENFVNECYAGDVEILAKNSKDYLDRSSILNRNARAVATCLQPYVSNASSSVSSVSYPFFSRNVEFWNRFKRPTTAKNDQFPAFEPGYGYVLSVEFKTMKATKTFFDSLQVHKGPHIGAHLTIALPYVKILCREPGDKLWLDKCGLNERMIRISVGLEDEDELVTKFQSAVNAADRA